MEKKFNVGDRVMCTDNGALGVITSIDIDPIGVCDGYTVLFDDGEETWICADMVVHSDEPPYDPKTAFLSELKGLLEKYNASIYVDFNQSDEIYTTTIAVGEDSVKYNSTDEIDCDNIMDYEKE
jgi:hypothetical protein|nr:MAG TPA: Tudor-interacting repair regulator protein [Caudoviricetes sp.]